MRTITLVIIIIVLLILFCPAIGVSCIQIIKFTNASKTVDNCRNYNFNLINPKYTKEMLLLGDSTVRGTSLSDCTESLAHKFHAKGYNITTIGEKGKTTMELCKLILDNKKHVSRKYDKTFIFIGANDIKNTPFLKDKIKTSLDILFGILDDYKKTLGDIYFLEKGNNSNISSVVRPFSMLLQNRVDIFDIIAKEKCGEHNINFINISKDVYKCGNKCRAIDGFHLNGLGFDIVVDNLKQYL